MDALFLLLKVYFRETQMFNKQFQFSMKNIRLGSYYCSATPQIITIGKPGISCVPVHSTETFYIQNSTAH